uniref:Uncharacterized protein n=1 Tax=Anguilla anguilla TaxID=7936 RepID=A0A0E9X656_ANGAN
MSSCKCWAFFERQTLTRLDTGYCENCKSGFCFGTKQICKMYIQYVFISVAYLMLKNNKAPFYPSLRADVSTS